MHAVTQGAVFNDRIMLPKEGSAFFRMAGIAIVINRILFQSSWSDSTMGIVAVATYQLVFADRVS